MLWRSRIFFYVSDLTSLTHLTHQSLKPPQMLGKSESAPLSDLTRRQGEEVHRHQGIRDVTSSCARCTSEAPSKEVVLHDVRRHQHRPDQLSGVSG